MAEAGLMYEGVVVDPPADVNRGPLRACSPTQVDEIRRLVAGGVPVAEAARRYGVTARTAYRYLNAPAVHVEIVVGDWKATFAVAPGTVPVRVSPWVES